MDAYETRLADVLPSPRIRLSGSPNGSWVLWPRTGAPADIAAGIVFARLNAQNAERWAASIKGRLPTLAEARAAVRSPEAIVVAFKAWPKTQTMRSREACAWWDKQLEKALGYLPRAQPVFAAKAWLALSAWSPPDGHPPPRPDVERAENWGAWKRDGRPDEMYQPGGWGSQDHDRAWTDYSQIPIAFVPEP